MKRPVTDERLEDLPEWAEPVSLWSEAECARVTPDASEARDWFELSTQLTRHEGQLAAAMSSDADFIISLRARIDASRSGLPAMLNASWRALTALAGVGVAMLALLFVLGQGVKDEHVIGDTQPVAVAAIPAEDIEYLAPVALAAAGETITADTLAAEFGVTELMSEIAAPQSEVVTTDDLLSLDEPVLAAVMDELESTRFF